MPPFALKRSHNYGRTAARAGKKNDDPEHRFQVTVATYLTYALPDTYAWTANAAGVRVAMQTAVKMKAAGVKRGWPDIQIRNRASGAMRFLELKTPDGRLSIEQKAFIADRPSDTAVCTTLEAVEAALVGWGIKPLCSIGAANRYAVG